MKRLAAALGVAAVNASAQCVMCFRTAEAQNAIRAHYLNLGVLILGVPPFLILAGFCYLCYRRSHQFADPDRDETMAEPASRAGRASSEETESRL